MDSLIQYAGVTRYRSGCMAYLAHLWPSQNSTFRPPYKHYWYTRLHNKLEKFLLWSCFQSFSVHTLVYSRGNWLCLETHTKAAMAM